ncbi:transmembrane transport protein [Microbacterium sp. HM58-2]|nr:transmembrane transport protein [Microbacterium sp. HM58-2]
MGKGTIVTLQVVIALALAGSLVVQTVFAPLIWLDLDKAPLWARISLVTIAVLGVLTMQIFAVCVWMLLNKVRRGSIFSPASFRFVDVIIGAIAAAAVLGFALAVVLAIGPAAPGVVALICGAAFTLGGMALLVVVMKALLRQAIELRSELDNEVI